MIIKVSNEKKWRGSPDDWEIIKRPDERFNSFYWDFALHCGVGSVSPSSDGKG
jgi:hypothetical protein